MNQAELLQYLRNNSTRCRINADTASDLDTAQTLLTMAEEIDLANSTIIAAVPIV